MQTLKLSLVTALATAAAAFLPSVAQAGLLGDAATLTFNSSVFDSPVEFASPQIVGDGVEFTGTGTDVFGQIWTFSVDVADNSVVFHFSESTRADEIPGGGGNLFSDPNIYGFDLSFGSSPAPTDWHLLSYNTLSSYGAYGPYGAYTSALTNIDVVGPGSIHFGFGSLLSSDTYVIGSGAEVPEPETMALFATGLGLMGFLARRRKAARQ